MRAALGVLVGCAVAVVMAVGLGFVFGGLGTGPAYASLLIGALAGLLVWKQIRPLVPQPPPGPIEWVVIAAFSLACFRAFFWLLYEKTGDLFVLSPNNLGDLALHIGLIRYLASGVPFWPESQILTGEALQYPIGADLFNSLLLLAGVPLAQGLVWTGAIASIVTGVVLWAWGRGFAIAALIFSGGLAGFAILAKWYGGEWGFDDYAGKDQWKNLFLAMFVTQRGLLFALPAGLVLLDEWRRVALRGEVRRFPAWSMVLLYAAMPLFSMHTFLFLSVALVGVFAFAVSGAERWRLVGFGLFAFLPATIFVILVTGFFSASGGVHWLPGWLQGDQPIRFWIWNFGLILPLAGVLLGWVIWRGDREARGVVLPAVVVFLMCVFVSFAVWPWDNTKLMIWSWLAIAPFINRVVISALPMPARWAVMFLLFFPGAVSLVGGLDGRHGYKLVDKAGLAATEVLVRDLPADARFAAAPDFAHPLILLGRKVAVGYDGHLWSHGYEYQDSLLALQTLMLGKQNWQNMNDVLDADYLFWGPLERARFPFSLRLWSEHYPRVARFGGFRVFDLRQPSPTTPPHSE